MIVLNDLYDYGLKIYQDNNKFKFSLDSLLLAEFVEINNGNNLLDLCSGNAPVPLILASKHDINVIGVEIQKDIYSLALESIRINKLEDKIKMYNINASEAENYFPGNNFDVITCNPPFFKVNKYSYINLCEEKAIARHEITINLGIIMRVVSKLLKNHGKFYMVHRPERIEEILVLANENKMRIKNLEFVYSKENDNAIMVLFKFVKNGNYGTKIKSKIIDRETKTYQNIFKEGVKK